MDDHHPHLGGAAGIEKLWEEKVRDLRRFETVKEEGGGEKPRNRTTPEDIGEVTGNFQPGMKGSPNMPKGRE